MQRGDIRWFRFSSPNKRRPMLVLGLESILSSMSQIPVIPYAGKRQIEKTFRESMLTL
jgi:hypothetical protein